MIVRKLTSDGIDDEDAKWGREGLKEEEEENLKNSGREGEKVTRGLLRVL